MIIRKNGYNLLLLCAGSAVGFIAISHMALVEHAAYSEALEKSLAEFFPNSVRVMQSTTDNINDDEAAIAIPRPSLDTIINASNELQIIGDPGWLLDFAIIGFGKCGTSTIMHWLREHPQVQAFGHEMSELMQGKPGRLVRKLYADLEAGPYKRGYKSPQDVSQQHIMEYYRRYWPHAKLFLGIRHPVRWFESLYNFRVQNVPKRVTMPHPNKLIGPCIKGTFHSCTHKGDFALSLFKLGKQHYPKPREANELEIQIVNRYRHKAWKAMLNMTQYEHMQNPIFLFDLDQLGDDDEVRNEQFRKDVTKFMGLSEKLPALPHHIPGKNRTDAEQVRRDALKINICEDEYLPVRQELMSMASNSSLWIRQVFLKNPTVFVSSSEYFEQIMEGWMRDPCDKKA